MSQQGFTSRDCGCVCTTDQGNGHGWGPDCCCVNVGNCDCTGNGYCYGCDLGGQGGDGCCCGGGGCDSCCDCCQCACAYRNLPTPACEGCDPCSDLGNYCNASGPWGLQPTGFMSKPGACCPIIYDTDPTTGDCVPRVSTFSSPFSDTYDTVDTNTGDKIIYEDCNVNCLESCFDNDIGQGRCWPCYPPTVLQRLDCTHWQRADLSQLTGQGTKIWVNPTGHGSHVGYRMWKANAIEDECLFFGGNYTLACETPDSTGKCPGTGQKVVCQYTPGADTCSITDLLSSIYNQDDTNFCQNGPFYVETQVNTSPSMGPAGTVSNADYSCYSYSAPVCNNCAGFPLNCGPGSTCGCGPCCLGGVYQAGGNDITPYAGFGYTPGCQ